MTRHRDIVELINSADNNSNDFGVRAMSVKRTLNPVLYNRAITPPRFGAERGTGLKLYPVGDTSPISRYPLVSATFRTQQICLGCFQ